MPGFNYGGSGASDHSGWSSENNPWGGGTQPGGGGHGNAGRNDHGGRISASIAILNIGESYMTSWGPVTINSQGHPVMNGIVMTASNSTMVADPGGGQGSTLMYTRVLNDLINQPKTPHTNNGGKSSTQVATENYLAGGSWAATGPVDDALINTAISNSLRNGIQDVRNPVLVTDAPIYKAMRHAFDTLPIDKQPAARDQIFQAWQKSYDVMPDKIRKEFQRGGKNGNSQFRKVDNPTKIILGRLIPQVKNDINNALSQNQAAAAKAKAKAKEKTREEKELLTKTSELIADVGEKVSVHLGDKYKEVAKKIADDIKNFHGKTIRSYEDAMKSLNKITSNPNMKIKKADKDAIINAWRSVNSQDMANRLGNLAKAFKVADIVQKIEKVREKSIEGYETGNWSPLILEVESWVISGMASAVALGVFGAILSGLSITGLALTVTTIVGIMFISYLSSMIDDGVVDKINNEVIKPAH